MPARIDVITNGVDLTNFKPQTKDQALTAELGLKGCFVAGYIGTHGMAHGLETLLEAAQTLQKMRETADIRLLFLGHGAEKAALVERSGALDLCNVLFLDTVPKSEVARYWSLLDVSIIHLRKTDLFNSVIPSKLFECMAMGIPVLHGVAGESAAIVQREDVGEVFESSNAEQLVQGLVRLRSDVARYERYRLNGPRAAAKYDRTALAGEMLTILHSGKVK